MYDIYGKEVLLSNHYQSASLESNTRYLDQCPPQVSYTYLISFAMILTSVLGLILTAFYSLNLGTSTNTFIYDRPP